MRVPGHTPGVCDNLISSLDIGPTLFTLVNLPGFHGMQGVDASQLLDSPGACFSEELLVEEDPFSDLLGIGQPLRMRTLKTPMPG